MRYRTRNNPQVTTLNPAQRGIVNGQRRQVVDSTLAPYRSVVQVQLNVASRIAAAASGAVVARNTILTAAHVIEDMQVGNLVTPGLNDMSIPFGTFRVQSLAFPEQYILEPGTDYRAPYYDYGIVIVEPNEDGLGIGDVVPPLPMRRTHVADLQIGAPVNLIGYPGDKGSLQMWECPGELLREDGDFYGLNELYDWPPRFLAYSCDAVGGNSGGPLLDAHGEIIGVMGILSENEALLGETGWGNGAIMLDDEAMEWLLARLQ